MSAPGREAAAPYRIRTRPEDFVVVEEPLYPASGEGGHTFVYVEKRGCTTEQVARELARLAGVRPADVGYAGRKDRHALTRQWFSLPELAPERALDLELRDARILEAARHPHKLRTGQLRANRFEIVLRGGTERGVDALRGRAAELLRRGLPNRYGSQRFGREGDNAERGRRILESRRPPRDRRAARFLVSALQSAVFNAVLEERGEGFDSVDLGDLARVEASGGLFHVEDLSREQPRAQAFEISATGPIFGTRMRSPREGVAQLEERVFEGFGLPELQTLRLPRGIRARGGRRPLRVRPEGLAVEPLMDGPGIRVGCSLPAGAYVTVLLEELVGDVVDASRSAEEPDAPEGARVSSEAEKEES